MNRTMLACALIVLPLLLGAAQQKELLIENRTGYPVDVLYIVEGKTGYTKHATIEAGAIMAQPVTSNRTWYFRVLTDGIIGQYTTSADEKQRVILDQDVLDAAGIPAAPQLRQDTSGITGSLTPQPMSAPTFTKPSVEPTPLPPKSEPVAQKAPPRGALVAWYDGAPPEARAITTNKTTFLNVGENGLVSEVSSSKGNEAKTTAAFMLKSVPGKKDTYRLQNVYYLDSYLYLDPHATEHAPVRCGPEGETLPTGEWRVEKGQYFYHIVNAAIPGLRIGVRNGSAVASAKTYGMDIPPQLANADLSDAEKKKLAFDMADTTAYNAGDAFVLFDVKSFRSLLQLVPALEQWGKNLEAFEKERKTSLEAAKKAEAEAKARDKERRRLAADPQVMHPFGSDSVAIRPGIGPVLETKEGYKVIKYKFAPDHSTPYLTADLRTSSNPSQNQKMNLYIHPEIAAWVQDGELYIGIDTSNETRIDLRYGSKPSTDMATDGNFYVGNVRMNIMPLEAKEVMMYPATENREVSAGSSSDLSKSINVSAEEILGADISESKGSNFNFQAREYEVSGGRGPADDESFGSIQYDWHGCGLADKTKTTKNCTYATPVDLFDKETLSLREIPKIAQSMSGLQTRTVLKTRIPVEGLSDRQFISIDVAVQLHMAKVVRSTKKNTKNKGWNDFKAGFTYLFRPDLWDFDKSFEDQQIIKEALYKPVGFTYDTTLKLQLWIQIEDLKPFMKK
ncbi:MAG: conserved exported protein of unknown function [Nitrospira sp.]|nr:MAG: conserved exported protein of unknown function [Nitrospira sp.]